MSHSFVEDNFHFFFNIVLILISLSLQEVALGGRYSRVEEIVACDTYKCPLISIWRNSIWLYPRVHEMRDVAL